MKKNVLITLVLLAFVVLISMRANELYWYQHIGYMINNENVKTSGVIETDGWGRLWFSQSTIGFCPNSKIDSTKKNPKIKCHWYKAAEIKEYGFGDKRFVTKKIKTTVGTVSRMLEVISEEEKTYKFYESSNGNQEVRTDPNIYSIYKENKNGELERIK